MQIIPCVGIVVFNQDQVLLVESGVDSAHITGTLGLPSGKYEPGETAVQAARRELEEETGIKAELSDLHQLPTIYHAEILRKKGVEQFEWTVFVCTKFIGELHATTETIPRWVKLDELVHLTLLPNVKEAIEEAKMKVTHLSV